MRYREQVQFKSGRLEPCSETAFAPGRGLTHRSRRTKPHAHQARGGTAFLLQEQAVVENLAQRKVEASRSLHRKVIYGTLYFDMPM